MFIDYLFLSCSGKVGKIWYFIGIQLRNPLLQFSWLSSRYFYRGSKIYCYANFYCFANFSIVLDKFYFRGRGGDGTASEEEERSPSVEESQVSVI